MLRSERGQNAQHKRKHTGRSTQAMPGRAGARGSQAAPRVGTSAGAGGDTQVVVQDSGSSDSDFA